MSSPTRRRIAVLVSGSGRSLANLLEHVERGELAAELGLVISSRAGVRALEHAAAHGIESLVIDPERALPPKDYSHAVFAACEAHRIDLVVLAGFLRFLPIPERWLGRVINIHPSLLPAFGGKGFYGERVHRAVLERGCQFTGCTVHFVTNEYDAGPIILQRCVPVLRTDTADTLAARVFEEEKRALPEALAQVLAEQSPAEPE